MKRGKVTELEKLTEEQRRKRQQENEEKKEKKSIIESMLLENNMIQETNSKDLNIISNDIKTLIYETEKMNKNLKESNMYLERISWRAGAIIFLMILPYIIKGIIIWLGANEINQTINDFIDAFNY